MRDSTWSNATRWTLRKTSGQIEVSTRDKGAPLARVQNFAIVRIQEIT